MGFKIHINKGVTEELRKEIRVALETTDSIRKESIKLLFEEVIDRTPVLTGRLKNNWFTSVNSPSRDSTKETDPSGAKSKSRVSNNLGKLGDAVYLSNNLPYVERIEFEGHSRVKAPLGMARISVAKFGVFFKRAVAKYGNKRNKKK